MLILPTQGKDFLRRCCTYFGIGGALILELTSEIETFRIGFVLELRSASSNPFLMRLRIKSSRDKGSEST